MKLYLVRHGETEWNHLRKMQGQMDIPLNEYGIELAEKTAEGMKDIKFDRIFASPLVRAKKTAEFIAENNHIDVETDDRLKEINFGEGEGSDINQAKADASHPLHNFFIHPEQFVPMEGGETFFEVQARGLNFLKEEVLPLEGTVENVAVVAHAAIIRSIMLHVVGRELKDFWGGIYYKNCCVCIIEVKGGQMTALEEAKVYY
ncbi:MAG: histidine phosphatase family protein [Lachnospiraceae bacterium]|nr:histidine phosphatase family protein [Lachnospiraceae bacterium]